MIKNYFKTAIRNIFKNWSYSLLNIIGLATGLAAVIFIALFIIHELTFDRMHTRGENIYRCGVYGKMMSNEFNQAVTAAPMGQAMKADYPQVKQVCRLREAGAWLVQYEDKKFNEEEYLFADSTFFDVFSFKLLKGDPNTALDKPRSIIMTESTAKRYFGDIDNVVGKMVKVESFENLYEITGVMEDVPENSHFHFDLLGSLNSLRASQNTFWISHNLYTYILLQEGTDPVELEGEMQQMIDKYVGPQLEQLLGLSMEEFGETGNTMRYFIQPLYDIHLHSELDYEMESNGSMTYVYIFIVIAIFILSIAAINFVNLSTAKAANRASEVGLRKVVGATKKQLVFQFLTESILISLLAMIVAILIVESFLNGFNNMVNLNLSVSYFTDWYTIPILIGLVFIVGFLSGSYPAFFLASFRPIAVLKGSMTLGVKGGFLRSFLVVFQLAVSIFILLSTWTVYDQLSYILNKDLGFEKENVLMIKRSDALDNKIDPFKEEVKKLPNVVAVTNSNTIPGRNFSNNAFFLEGQSLENTYLLHQARINYDFDQTLGFELVEGRFFSKEFPTDSFSCVINEAAVKSLGLEDPIGFNIMSPQRADELFPLPIIGIVKDFHFKSLHTEIQPVIFTFLPRNVEGLVCIKLDGSNTNRTIQQVENLWEEFVSDYPFQYFFFDDELNEQYSSERITSRIFVAFSFLSILIALLGLLGLISFAAIQRKKEIGVRKTFGSTSSNIVMILSKEIVKLVVIAMVIAWPIAYFVMKNWLQDFSYRVDINYVMFVVIALITLIVAVLAVMYQAVMAARRNPADILRYE